MVNFVRNFVSVGQGGFSIEKFYYNDKVVFCMVYDCGSSSFKSKKMGMKITEHFDIDDKINALFISHFDDDHINGISILLEKYCVDRIYLPILSKSEKILLNASMNDNKILSFINDPIKYISNIVSKKQNNKINIVFVRNLNRDNDAFDEERRSNDNIRISYINSGDAILFDELNNNIDLGKKIIWEYIPYNVSFDAYDDLNTEINKKLGNQDLKDILKNSTLKSKLKEIYEKVLNNHKIPIKDDNNQNNLNSLILYSGPKKESNIGVELSRFCNDFFRYKYDDICCDQCLDCATRLICCQCLDYSRLFRTKAGCLYFGDSDAKDKKVIDLLNKHIHSLSFVQVPHHGSKYNNDDKIVKNDLVFIIFAGTKNTYNHPSESVVEKLNIFEKMYFIVTEHRESELIAIYDLYKY